MDLSEFDSRFLNLWQRLRLQSVESSTSGSRPQHDACRGQLVQLQYLNKTGKLSKNCYLDLLTQYGSQYGRVIDNQDTSKGLNNFAEAILSLASGQRNESQEWKSSLNLNAVLQSSLWKKLQVDKSKSVSLLAGPTETKIDSTATKPLDEESTPQILTKDQNSSSTTTNVNKPGGKNLQTSLDRVTENPQSSPSTDIQRNQRLSQASVNVDNSSMANIEASARLEKKAHLPSIETGSSQEYLAAQPVDYQESKTLFRFDGKQQGLLMDGARVFNKRKASDAFNDDERGGIFTPSHLRARSTQESARHQANLGRAKTSGSTFYQTRNQYMEQQNFPRFGQDEGFVKGCREEVKMGVKQVEDEDFGRERPPPFVTAREQYVIDCKKKKSTAGTFSHASYGSGKKTLGLRRGPSSKFVPPILNRHSDEDSADDRRNKGQGKGTTVQGCVPESSDQEPEVDERLKNIEPKMIELITNEIMDHGPPVMWSDIAGLEFAKNVIKEMVVWPMLRPDIFKGLRGPPKGLLLFGPPGTGKTLIGKCIASQSKATFFSISASSLTSKWVGEGEKMVRALFAVARCNLPAVIFIDEIDSLLSQRTDGEHDASRRIKTEFLVQLDGAATNSDERILVVGATNRPQEIDEAARRRLVKRLYIPLPEADARRQIIHNLLAEQSYHLSEEHVEEIVRRADGYSGADMSNLCREAALGPIRSLSGADIQHISTDQVRPIVYDDFDEAFGQVRASVSKSDLNIYVEWNRLFGSGKK